MSNYPRLMQNIMRTVVLAVVLLAGTVISPPNATAAQSNETWRKIVHCETGGTMNFRLRNHPYESGFQFHHKTWDAYRQPHMPGHAADAHIFDMVWVAEQVLAAQGWKAWPTCSRKVGLR